MLHFLGHPVLCKCAICVLNIVYCTSLKLPLLTLACHVCGLFVRPRGCLRSERGCVSLNLKLVGLDLGIILHFEQIKLGKPIDSDNRTKNIQQNGVILNFEHISNLATFQGWKFQGWSWVSFCMQAQNNYI